MTNSIIQPNYYHLPSGTIKTLEANQNYINNVEFVNDPNILTDPYTGTANIITDNNKIQHVGYWVSAIFTTAHPDNINECVISHELGADHKEIDEIKIFACNTHIVYSTTEGKKLYRDTLPVLLKTMNIGNEDQHVSTGTFETKIDLPSNLISKFNTYYIHIKPKKNQAGIRLNWVKFYEKHISAHFRTVTDKIEISVDNLNRNVQEKLSEIKHETDKIEVIRYISIAVLILVLLLQIFCLYETFYIHKHFKSKN